MTRHRAKQLEYDYPLPKMLAGKKKVYEEVFINSGGEATEEDAYKHLRAIQQQHDTEHGWNCPGGIHEGVFQDTDKKWYAYRHQGQYRIQ